MSKAAQAVQKAVEEMVRRRPARKQNTREEKHVDDFDITIPPPPIEEPQQEEEMAKSEKKTKSAKKPKSEKPAKPAKPAASALAGIKTAPKLPGLLLGTEISRKVVAKALAETSSVKDFFNEEESREVERLQARLAARG